MSYIIGIDTGGTYTDGVVVEKNSRKILRRAKALTTREDLTIGISECLAALAPFEDISLVCFSTTLATNSVVEGKLAPTGAIFIGKEPSGNAGAALTATLDGSLDIKGRIKKELKDEDILAAIDKIRGVSAVAISGYASVRNPEHELRVKRFVTEKMGVPVVCAHELTSSLGFTQRSATAIMNAGLIPVIKKLLASLRESLKKFEISSSVMIVRGDGTLVSADYAEARPIETALSGPAASIAGGKFLSGLNDFVLMDMGGTTTDTALCIDGTVPRVREGARVNGTRTLIEAADVCTFGLGGDSRVWLSGRGELRVGPERVTPLCIAAAQYPTLGYELMACSMANDNAAAFDMFTCWKAMPYADPELTLMEGRVLSSLKDGPHTQFWLIKNVKGEGVFAAIEALWKRGLITRIGLTPTDVLRAEGLYDRWNSSASEVGVLALAAALEVDRKDIFSLFHRHMTEKICRICIRSVAEFEHRGFQDSEEDAAEYLLDKGLGVAKGGALSVKFALLYPIVAVGAPVSAWMDKVSEELNTTLCIPENADVACAVGAAVGSVIETAQMLIRPNEMTGEYIVFAPWERRGFNTLEEARRYAEPALCDFVLKRAKKAGGEEIKTVASYSDVWFPDGNNGKKFIEARISASASGRPAGER